MSESIVATTSTEPKRHDGVPTSAVKPEPCTLTLVPPSRGPTVGDNDEITPLEMYSNDDIEEDSTPSTKRDTETFPRG